MFHEALLRQGPRIVAQLKLEIPNMVRSNDNLELGDTAGCIRGFHITHSVVALGTIGWIPANPMLVLCVGVGSKHVHIARPTADGAIIILIPCLRDRQAPMALCHTCRGSKNKGCDKALGSHERRENAVF